MQCKDCAHWQEDTRDVPTCMGRWEDDFYRPGHWIPCEKFELLGSEYFRRMEEEDHDGPDECEDCIWWEYFCRGERAKSVSENEENLTCEYFIFNSRYNWPEDAEELRIAWNGPPEDIREMNHWHFIKCSRMRNASISKSNEFQCPYCGSTTSPEFYSEKQRRCYYCLTRV